MIFFNPFRPVTRDNYAIKADYYFKGDCHGGLPIIKERLFGSAAEFAEWLDAFDYSKGDVFGWQGDGAVMEAVESHRANSEFVAIPEYITEYNMETGESRIIGPDEFSRKIKPFRKDRGNYRIHRNICDGEHYSEAKVHSVMRIIDGTPSLGPFVWHVPFGAEEIYG